MSGHLERNPQAAPAPANQDPAPQQQQRQAPAQQVGPGLRRMLELVQGNASPDATAAFHILRDYPGERVQLLEALHQHGGNGFATRVLQLEREDRERPRAGLNDAGLGVTAGNWQVGVVPAGSTDDRYDNHQNRARAERTEEDARAAQRNGETAPNPVMDLIRPQPRQVQPAPEVDAAIAQAREQINPTPQLPMEIDPVTLLPIIPGLNRRRDKHF